MFSVAQKRRIAELVQNILRETDHPELPAGEIQFHLHVDGAEAWSWANIKNNGAILNPQINPHNEAQDGGMTAEVLKAYRLIANWTCLSAVDIRMSNAIVTVLNELVRLAGDQAKAHPDTQRLD